MKPRNTRSTRKGAEEKGGTGAEGPCHPGALPDGGERRRFGGAVSLADGRWRIGELFG